jgi:hypothetical protein
VYLHVGRKNEIDFRGLYSEWMAHAVKDGVPPIDFAELGYLVDSSRPHMMWYGDGRVFGDLGRLGGAIRV